MIETEASIVIQLPIDVVFNYVADQTNAPIWQEGLLEVRRLTDGPIGVGTKHDAVRVFMGRRLEATNEYVIYEPNRQVTFKGTAGSAPFEHSYLTEPASEGTKLTSRMLMQTEGFAGLIKPLIAAGLKRDFANNLGKLKKLLESAAGQ